jgi:hypothetical protein
MAIHSAGNEEGRLLGLRAAWIVHLKIHLIELGLARYIGEPAI